MRKSELELASVAAARYLLQLIEDEAAPTKDRLAATIEALDRVHGKPAAQAPPREELPLVRIIDDIPRT